MLDSQLPQSEVASPSMSQNTWVIRHYLQSVLHGAELILNELNIFVNTYPGSNLRINMLLGEYSFIFYVHMDLCMK